MQQRRRSDGPKASDDAPLWDGSREPQAPAILHIDLADLAAAATHDAPLSFGVPPWSAIDETLLEEARKAADGAPGTRPSRELIAVALRAAAREQEWRDQAEAAAREAALTAVRTARRIEELERFRHRMLGIQFELVAYVSHQLKCGPTTGDVLARIRALGSGFIVPPPATVPVTLTGTEGDHHA